MCRQELRGEMGWARSDITHGEEVSAACRSHLAGERCLVLRVVAIENLPQKMNVPIKTMSWFP